MYPNDSEPRTEEFGSASGTPTENTAAAPSGNYDPRTGAYIGGSPEPQAAPHTDGGYGHEWHGSPYSAVPPTPPQPPKQKKEKKRGFGLGKVIALCLVCAILGGGVSGGVFALLSSRTPAGAAVSDAGSDTTSTLVESDRTPTTNVETSTVAAGEAMSVSQIYAAYAGSVVSVEVSTATASGAGTGFVITEDGYIVTCYHVISGATDIAVTFSDSTSYEATLVGGDEDQDIAVLKIDATGLTPVVLGDSGLLQVGDTVTTIGNALGTLANTTTTGVVSALDRAISMSDGTVINVLQTDCTVNSGNSGGPLFNQYGEVIGIVNAKYSSNSLSTSAATIEGIGFAIPYADVATKITDLMEYGYITGKPSLGITVSTVSALDAQRFNLVVGAYVNSVNAGSCADTAGLQQGDIITAVNGEEITTYEELVNAKNQLSAGDEMVLSVYRSGETLTLTVILDEDVPTEDTTGSQSAETGETPDGQQDSGSDSDGTTPDFSQIDPEEFFEYFFGGGNRGSSGSW